MITYLPHRRLYHSAPPGNGLLNGLLHWWDLDETSGDAIAQAGGVDLTDGNTVTYTAGGAPDGGNSRFWTYANNEKFSASGLLGSGTAITMAIWFKATNVTNGKSIWGHNAPNGFTRLRHTATNGWLYVEFDGLGSRAYQSSIGTGWNSLVATSTGPGGTDTAYLNGTAFTGGAVNQGWEPGTATYYLGSNQLGQNGSCWGGDLVSHGIWDRVFNTDDVAAFHNSGVNLRHADLTA